MQKVIQHPTCGRIVYDENIWTGKKSLTVDGRAWQKKDKTTFLFQEGENILVATLKGSVLTGVTLSIQGERIAIVPKPSVLDWILALLPFLVNIVWSNSVELCSIIPVVGGALGGALNGVAIVIGMNMIREKRGIQKLLTGLLVLVVAFAVCALLGFVMLASIA